MGFFSWMTADTHISIPVEAARIERGCAPRTVYLVQPDGFPPIVEDSYEGYGVFGGVDAFEWIARSNMPNHLMAHDAEDDGTGRTRLRPDQLRDLGCALTGDYLEDVETGRRLAIFHNGAQLVDPTIEFHAISYAQPIPGYDGRSANDLTKAGVLQERRFEIGRPLKFSHNPNAVYENLPASADCPDQGYFY